PKWLQSIRLQSREAFNDCPIPKRGLHLWRYTDPALFMATYPPVSNTVLGKEVKTTEQVLQNQVNNGDLSGLVTDLGDSEINIHQSSDLISNGVIVTKLSDAVRNHREQVEPYLYRLINSDTGKFEALNGALWNDGIFIYVPEGKVVEKPLHILREAGDDGSVRNERLLIVLGKDAELTVIDEYIGGASIDNEHHGYTNSAVEVFGLEGSRGRYVSLHKQASVMNSYLTFRARIDRNATMLTIPLDFGGATIKHNYGVILDGENAESNMYGLVFGSDRQHFDNHTLHHHTKDHTRSNIDFKVVLQDKSVSAYTGLIRIENNATGCEAYQENRNLLLNRGVKAETIPELEILNEDVQCSHGATTGPIDPLSIFYLQARGIEQHEAVQMITSGFVASTIKQLPSDLQERINSFVAQRLEHL
ncbi:MAG: Fe-S cluster assembly protein SufD, partial [candidate division Zixibacteria bacterium]|nr:Fe-S cluster assembly protein SufD [candidate division Zixibacteria bacterium]